ncbi:MAG: hypothetical protein IH840_14245 [Candidatus Heimdallarchaeota archaeon]|nr:hypothetical protein [Candidatus Heimdallarchaeota archaeon]
MIYRFYRFKGKAALISENPEVYSFTEFQVFYYEHNVKIIGGRENVDDPTDYVLIAGYENEDHYRRFVKAMKDNKEHQRLRDILIQEREIVEQITFKIDPRSPRYDQSRL